MGETGKRERERERERDARNERGNDDGTVLRDVFYVIEDCHENDWNEFYLFFASFTSALYATGCCRCCCCCGGGALGSRRREGCVVLVVLVLDDRRDKRAAAP